MDQTLIDVPVFCKQEDIKIGNIRTLRGRMKLTVDMVWARFVPVDGKYKLVEKQRDGEYFKCPHCHGPVVITGDLQFRGLAKDGQTASKKIGVEEGATIEIILGQAINVV